MNGRILPLLVLPLIGIGCSEPAPVEPVPIDVSIAPARVEVRAGASQPFAASIAGSSAPAVEWRVSDGTIEKSLAQSMVWRAPLEPGRHTITAISVADTTARATAVADVRVSEGTVTADFSDYRGTLETLPEGMFVTGENAAGDPIGAGFDPFTGVHELTDGAASFEGLGAFTDGEGQPSFGIRERGETDLRNARLFLAYTNETDRPVTGFDVEYDVETWRIGERANRIRLKFGTDTVGYSALPELASTVSPRGAAVGDDVGRVVSGRLEENRTTVHVRIELAAVPAPDGGTIDVLEPGETGYFRWQYSNAVGDRGKERSALGLSGLRIVPMYTAPGAPDPARSDTLRFSHEPGFYTEPFTLELATAFDSATIYYSLDGSEPGPGRVMSDEAWEALSVEERERTFVYERPIDLTEALERPAEISLIPTTEPGGEDRWREPTGEVQTAVVVRVRVDAAGEETRVLATETRTYLIAPEGRDRYTLPIVSLATDRDGFFSSRHGIYVPGETGENYMRRGKASERLAHLEYFERSGERALAQRVGVRMHGGTTRSLAKKGLRVYSRSNYGTSRLRYPFFESKEIDDFNRLLLRASGNDWSRSLMRDAAAQTLVEHLSFDTQHYAPVIVFLNGEYWGIHNLRDRFDPHYLETHYGVSRDQVAILKLNELNAGEPGDEVPYQDVLHEALEGRLTTREAFDAHIDLDNLLDYIVAQMYAGNTDWPHNNIRWWRYTGSPDSEPGPRDGRWRWMMYDVDRSFGYENSPSTNMLEHVLHSADPSFSRGLIHALLDVPELRHELIQRIAVHLATTFEPDRVRHHIDSLAARIEPEIEENNKRWTPEHSPAHWDGEIGAMRIFADDRPDHVRTHVIDHFDEVDGTAELEVAGLGDEGTVRLYTVPLEAEWPGVEIVGGVWRGELFTGVPVVLRGEGLDLSDAEVTGAVEAVEASAGALRFVMRGAARVRLR